MLRIALCLLLVGITTGQQYSPYCQNWCYGPQPIVNPQVCGTYCGGYTGGYNYYNPCDCGCSIPCPCPVYPPYPVTVTPPMEWVCPTDPVIRYQSAQSSAPSSQPPHCTKDEDCTGYTVPTKCCYDTGIGAKVCKPAIPSH